VFGADPGEDYSLGRQFDQVLIRVGTQLLAGYDVFCAVGVVDSGDMQKPGDCPGRLGMVACDHFYVDAGFLAGGNRLNGFRTRRVDHSLKAEENESVGDVCMVHPVFFGQRFLS